MGELWKVYLPVILIALVCMVPAVFYLETRKKHKIGLEVCVAVLAVLLLLWGLATYSFWASVIALLVFFIVFNVLEALQPSMVSRVTPPQHKGLALGLYNMSQALGVAAGGAVGGLLGQYSPIWVFVMAALLSLGWFLVARKMKPMPI